VSSEGYSLKKMKFIPNYESGRKSVLLTVPTSLSLAAGSNPISPFDSFDAIAATLPIVES